MSPNNDPRNPERGRVSGRDMADALANVLKEQDAKTETRLKPAPQKKNSPFAWVLLAVFGALAGYVWIGSPAWLQPEPVVLSPALADAGLRMEVFQQALLVEQFLETQGRLPQNLSEAGSSFSEADYVKIDLRDYRIRLVSSLGEVEYVSTDSLDAFLGNSLQVIRQGG